MWPTMRSSTSWNSLLLPGRLMAPAYQTLSPDLEQGDVGADGRDDAGRIPAQHFRLAVFRRAVLAHLGVDGVDGNGLDGDEQVAPRGDGHGQLDVEQGVGIRDGQAVVVGDGFHVLPR